MHHPAAPEQIELSPAEFQARLRWARGRGHPLYVWPAVPPAEWRAALRELERVARAVLQGRRGEQLSVHSGAALGVAAFTSGLGPLLGWWIEAGLLQAAPAERALLALHLEHGRERALRMQRTLHECCAVLQAAGVPVIPLKGAHTAGTVFPEPGTRPMADLDLLVAPHHIKQAEAALLAAGFSIVPGSRLLWPYRSDWQPPGVSTTVRSSALHHRDNPYTVDLHAALDVDFFGVRTLRFRLPPPGELAAASWAGPHALALPETLLIAHQAAHTAQGLYNLTLIRQVELVLLLRPAGRSIDWNALRELLRATRALRFVYPAFELAERLLPGTVQPALYEEVQRAATRGLRGVLAGLEPGTAQRLEVVALNEQFMWAATPFEHIRRALRMLVPGGGSARRLVRIYIERVFRVLRGRVRLYAQRETGF